MHRTLPPSMTAWAFVAAVTLVAACGDDDKATAAAADSNTGIDDSNPGPADSPGTTTTACVPATEEDYVAFQAKVGAPNQDPCSKQMVDQYTVAGFDAVTGLIVNASLDANNIPLIESSFKDKLANASDARKTQFSAHLSKFLQTVYGPADVYPSDAPAMPAAHKPLNITFDQYLNFATKIVVPALQTAGVTSEHIDKCFVPPVLADATVRSMVFCK